jgi:hypothetical protein
MDAGPELIGRQRELDVLTELVDQGTVRGGALVVRGDPGIGKSALLGALLRAARARGLRVLTSVGVQSEAQLPGLSLWLVRFATGRCREWTATRSRQPRRPSCPAARS